jgi:hypothetical protein
VFGADFRTVGEYRVGVLVRIINTWLLRTLPDLHYVLCI